MARVHVIKETTDSDPADEWRLWLQWCRYDLDDDQNLFGYRFIWKNKGALQAARGQARIPNIDTANRLMAKAAKEGWGDRDGDRIEKAVQLLEEHGCVVSLTTGYVGWPDKEAAIKGRLTPEIIEATDLIREWA